jgi:outer membrane protein OmpA-like peptidoglycan-associated protein
MRLDRGLLWAICLLALTLAPDRARAQDAGAARAQHACEAVAARITAARAAWDLPAATNAYEQGLKPESSCSERALFCLGRSTALVHLAEVYARAGAEKGTDSTLPDEALADIEGLLRAGQRYGRPWQLLVALADYELERAKRAHDPALFSTAAFDYQLALFDLGDFPSCGDYGEPPDPTGTQIAQVYQRMSTALLLASPLKIATSRCSVCQWAFLAGIRNFTPSVRPLPITFDPNRSEPTPEGRQAIASLLDCAKAQRLPRIVLSGHTDDVGSARFNMRLSAERLASVERLLKQGGFTGEIVLEPKGKSEPYDSNGLGGYSQDEIKRLNRRIELRALAAGEAPSCGP